MPVDSSVEPDDRAWMVQSPNDPPSDKRFQNTVHRGEGEPRDSFPHSDVNLVGGWVVVPLQHHLENLPSLGRQRQAPPAAKGLKLPQPCRDLVLLRWSSDSNASQSPKAVNES